MRRLTALFAAMVLLLSGCGGKNNESQGDQSGISSAGNYAVAMTMTRTRFSQETEDILKLLEVDGGFFDFCVDDTITGFTMDVWVLTDGEWVSSGKIDGRIENKQGQVGVQLLKEGCNFFQLNGAGHTKYSVKYDTGLNKCAATARLSLGSSAEATVIEAGKEQFLFIELGWNDAAAVNQVTGDFRNSSCDAGVAATITFTASSSAG